MVDISKVNRFKAIDKLDNILVREGTQYKKSNFDELSSTVFRYIDLNSILTTVASRRDDFINVFISKGIVPLLRMACTVEIVDVDLKTVKLKQKPLEITGNLRYKDIPFDYLMKGILEVFIETLPPEVLKGEESLWSVLTIETPFYYAPVDPIAFSPDVRCKKEKTEEPDSVIMLLDFILGKPTKFIMSMYLLEPYWFVTKDTFPGRVEVYGSSTGIDGYTPYSIPTDDLSYLGFINSNNSIIPIVEDISRTKSINLNVNNILDTKYVDDISTNTPLTVLQGKELELLPSSIPDGSGVDSLGIQLIRRKESMPPVVYKPGRFRIGTIMISMNKEFFGKKLFSDGYYIGTTLDDDTVYNSIDYPYFCTKLNITTPTFKVVDYFHKLDNPYSIDKKYFTNYKLGFTNKAEEMGMVVSDKVSLNIIPQAFVYSSNGSNDFAHKHKFSNNTAYIGTADAQPSNPVRYAKKVAGGVRVVNRNKYIEAKTSGNLVFSNAESRYIPRTRPIKAVTFERGLGTDIPKSHSMRTVEDSLGCVFYVVLDFN